ASQSIPKGPLGQTTNGVASNVNQQAQDASDKAKRDLLTSLDKLEEATLQGAIDSAVLLRDTYDVFVSPILTVSATITADVLQGMLNAVKFAESVLNPANQNTQTLKSVETVLQAWVDKLNQLPRQLNASVDTSLDGAQAYLHALQRKIEDDLKKLNS